MCPTCHRPLHDEGTRHPPAFMDSDYFRLLSATNAPPGADGNNILPEDEAPAPELAPEDPISPGHLPKSAFNQGYFEQ